ncbi:MULTISPECIES: glycolate oxidase subunit GlcE [Methylosinus]|uniref:Glycolate oxidase subunit GlcE n=1 Tax=Methylosinus trichosporium (strain ATCC 35070 / NCIMB 11131 / UNIQEM 75 / OB3b) TaxID=595536 RepID=A0A2D2CWS0_METT3|nr:MULTISPECIES: glycolate oxidase subunit GlcE [Methylosinus]ATQ67211.1 glycolate oxidase subunit GlcE [Methylosinus trichosporium OB3b]OBS52226.1 FAD-linked oxidase [Methylosinus sp. 3S-1]
MTPSPRDETDVRDAIRDALAAETPLAIRGHGSKAGLGRAAAPAQILSLAALSGVTLYEPEELVLTARAGTPLREIVALLDAHRQQLAFEPMDHALLLGGARDDATIGGVVAVNASGPRRIKAGAARDHLLGFRCVTGRGEIVKSGGRVMKNVTGYDLSKLVAGSYGTLAVLTETTFKVLPQAETEQTLLLSGLGEEKGLAALRKASGSPYEVSSLAFDPRENIAALRLEGPEISVVKRRDDLVALLAPLGAAAQTLEAESSRAFWMRLRDGEPVAAGEGVVWRISLAPSDGFTFVESLRRNGAPLLAHVYDWAGGLVWLRLEAAPDAHAGAIRAVVDRLGGHATLIRADEATRATVDVFHPQPAALAALTRRVKDAFDPLHILERGRMRADF